VTKRHLLFWLLSITLFAVLGGYVKKFTKPFGYGDAEIYIEIADSPGTFVRSPWGYRIGVPYLAAFLSDHLLFSLGAVFRFLQWSMYGTILAVIVHWVRDIGNEKQAERNAVAIQCALLFVLSYPGVYHLHNVAHVGFAEHLLVLLGGMAIYYQRFGWLCLIVVVSGLVKESVGLLLVPTFLASAFVFSSWKTAVLRTACLTALFAAPFCLLRSGVLFHNQADAQTYLSFYTWGYVSRCFEYWGGLRGAAGTIWMNFGPLWLLAIAGFVAAPPRIKTLMVLPLLAIMQIVLAADVERAAGVGVPVLIVISSYSLRSMKAAHAAWASGLVGLHFLCVNHRVGSDASLQLAVVLILVLLWFNRSALFTAAAAVHTNPFARGSQ